MGAFTTQGKWDIVKIGMPIVVGIVISLLTVLYNLQNTAIAEKASKEAVAITTQQLKEELQGKVDDATLKAMLELFKQQNNFQNQQIQKQQVIDEKTLEMLQKLNVSLKILEQKLN